MSLERYKNDVKAVVENAVATRMAGKRPSRIQALITAGLAAAAAGITVYRLLRSSNGGDNPDRAS
jgi:predicted transcriptional regulator